MAVVDEDIVTKNGPKCRTAFRNVLVLRSPITSPRFERFFTLCGSYLRAARCEMRFGLISHRSLDRDA